MLIFGAGASGRGHLGELLYRDGNRNLVFVDKKKDLVEMLNQAGGYPVRLLTDNETPGFVRKITNVKAYCRCQEEEIQREFCEARLVLTCVIAENLPDIAGIAGKCIRRRFEQGIRTEMNIVCCENLDHASSWLRQMVLEKLEEPVRTYCEQYIGFPDAMISRVVPVPPAGSLDIVTEDYNEWTIDAGQFKGEDPGFADFHIVNNLDARLERKLWIHNGGHASMAYASARKGYRYVHEALQDNEIAEFTGAVLDEIGNCVFHKYPKDFTLEVIRSYEADLGRRGAIAEMKDEISRVVRDPLRKLGLHDRLLAPAVYAVSNNISCPHLIRAIVNATLYESPADAESLKMQEIIKTKGYEFFINETLGLKEYPELAGKIIKEYRGASL